MCSIFGLLLLMRTACPFEC